MRFNFGDFWDDYLYSLENCVEPPPSDELIASIEQELGGYRLPAVYVDLARRHNGATLLVRRGVELLEQGRGYGILSFSHTSPPDHIKLRVPPTSLGVATVLYPAFNRFAGTSILGSTSELHELVATSVTVAGEALQGLRQGRSTPPRSTRASSSTPAPSVAARPRRDPPRPSRR